MDNITHSLAGLLIAAVAIEGHRTAASAAPSRVPTAEPRLVSAFSLVTTLTAVVGANLPDSDVLIAAAFEAAGRWDDLLALLHHRGYTHTVAAALLFVPLLWWAACAVLARRAGPGRPSRDERRRLLLVAMVSVASHVTLDFTNDYGVHPFAPVTGRWFYGDTIFIIEPWLWIASVPMLHRTTASRAGRIGLLAILVLALGLSWAVPMVATATAVALTLGAAAWLAVARRMPVRSAAVAGIAAWGVVTTAFAVGTGAVRGAVVDAIAAGGAATPGALRLHDVVVSPSPGNPLCGRVITVESDGARYQLTTAHAAAVPALVTASWCARSTHADTTRGAVTLPMVPSSRGSTEAVRWGFGWTAPRADLQRLASTHCEVAAWLRFVRAPFWIEQGDSVMVGDLRYDRDRGVGVAQFTFAARPVTCPVDVPSWQRPRADVWPERATVP